MGHVTGIGAGRPKKPSAIKKLNGTYRGHREIGDEVEYPEVQIIPPAPRHLDAIGKKVWSESTQLLLGAKILTPVDYVLLEQYCDQVSRLEICRKTLKKEGLLIKHTNKSGATNLIAHPMVKISNDTLTNVIRLAAQFGFSPAARTKVSVPNPDTEGDEFEKF